MTQPSPGQDLEAAGEAFAVDIIDLDGIVRVASSLGPEVEGAVRRCLGHSHVCWPSSFGRLGEACDVGGDTYWHPPFDSPDPLSRADLDVLAGLVTTAASRLFLARVHDLLWVHRHSGAGAHVLPAIDSYLHVAQTPQRIDNALRFLERAAGLAKRANSAARLALVAEAALARVGRVAEEHDPEIGLLPELWAARCLHGIANAAELARDEPCLQRFAVFVAERAEILHSFPSLQLSYFRDLQFWLAGDDEEERRAVADQAVLDELRGTVVWGPVNDPGAAMGAKMHLAKALALTIRYEASAIGQDDLAVLFAQLPFPDRTGNVGFGPEDITDADRTAQAMWNGLGSMVADGSYFERLEVLGTAGPPTWPTAEIDAEADGQAEQFGGTMFPLGPRGMALQIIETQPTFGAWQRAFRARVRTGLWGDFIADLIDQAAVAGEPSDDELLSFYVSPAFDAEIAERVAACHRHYLAGRYDESAHLLAPRLEAGIRAVAMTSGIPVLSFPSDRRNLGGAGTLGTLLDRLRQHSGGRMREWWRYLFHLLSDPLSVNLRNELTHGLRGEMGRHEQATRVESALLLHVAWFLRCLDPVPKPLRLPAAVLGPAVVLAARRQKQAGR